MNPRSRLVIQILNDKFQFNTNFDHYLVVRVNNKYVRCNLEYGAIVIDLDSNDNNTEYAFDVAFFILQRLRPSHHMKHTRVGRERVLVDYSYSRINNSAIVEYTPQVVRFTNMGFFFPVLKFSLNCAITYCYDSENSNMRLMSQNHDMLTITPTGLANTDFEDTVVTTNQSRNRYSHNITDVPSFNSKHKKLFAVRALMKSKLHKRQNSLESENEIVSVVNLDIDNYAVSIVPSRQIQSDIYSHGRTSSVASDTFSMTTMHSDLYSNITVDSTSNNQYYAEVVHHHSKHGTVAASQELQALSNEYPPQPSLPINKPAHFTNFDPDNVKVTGYTGRGTWIQSSINKSLYLWYLQPHIPSLEKPALPPKHCPPNILWEEYYLISGVETRAR